MEIPEDFLTQKAWEGLTNSNKKVFVLKSL
jgi:hypothetical protein